MPFMLGKHPPVIDPRTRKLGDYLGATVARPRVPAAQAWSTVVPRWGPMLNDRISCCAISGPGHLIQLWTAYTRLTPVIATDQQIASAYSDVGGYDPRTGAHDDGCNMLAVMKYWRDVGIAGHRIAGFASVNPHDPEMVATAIFLFGGVMVGYNLPMSSQQQIAAGNPWTVTSGRNAQPGSWGGHLVIHTDYDSKAETFHCITWGQVQEVSYGFNDTYCDEMYVCLTDDWIFGGSVSPSGFDYATLKQDLKIA